jgi:hypothetical protein
MPPAQGPEAADLGERAAAVELVERPAVIAALPEHDRLASPAGAWRHTGAIGPHGGDLRGLDGLPDR